jgi:protein O-GlcNAc transferase
VPVVTLRWHTIAGRLSASVLTTLDLCDWIAETPEQYVRIAVQKAHELNALAELRKQLRGKLMASVIGDGKAYVTVVEREYRQLWQQWCTQQNCVAECAVPAMSSTDPQSL